MIDVVGIGPGGALGMTAQARLALERADVLAGYSTYLDLVRSDFPHKPVIETGMRGERERCAAAIEASRQGRRVAMVCSGDAGVYGMAALLLQLASGTDEVRVIPGVTAALSTSALLGAPISGDFAAVSLSDLLTPWQVIEKRLVAACAGDFVIALYNPRSRGRASHLRMACEIIMEHRDPNTPCGLAQNIGREGEKTQVLTILELAQNEQVDMFTTAIIGNSQTVIKGGKLVTPRGYAL